MSLRKIVFFSSILLSLVSLSLAYYLIGQIIVLIFILLLGAGWLLALKYPSPSGFPPICLTISFILAAAGVLLSAQPFLLIFGAGTALIAWDVVLLAHPANIPANPVYEIKHIQTLLVVLAFSLLMVAAGLWLHLQLPFFVLLLISAALFFGLDRMRLVLKKRG
ncbi:MAG: hypothetical protein LWX83_03505 [Anaerolineae bacterium]|nr:hypothetical protein [Anaerolineae bacterium]